MTHFCITDYIDLSVTSFTLPDGNTITINTHVRFALQTSVNIGSGSLSRYYAKFYMSDDNTYDAADVEVSLVTGWGTGQDAILTGVSSYCPSLL